MKFTLLSLVLLITFNTYGQDVVKFEKVDSVDKTKAQIYSATKMFIAERWNSAKDVIQNDDKDGGIIILQGIVKVKQSFFIDVYAYIYKYTITFRMKDRKFRISINDVYCSDAYFDNSMKPIAKINPFWGDNFNDNSLLQYTLPKKKAILMMENLRSDLQNLVNEYSVFVKSSDKNEDW